MVNKDALDLIMKFEGVRLKAYPDPGSRNGLPWTIGYGHTKDVKKGDVITQEQAAKYLVDDLKVAERAIAKHITVPLNENQYGALVSFIHNVGETQFAEGSVKKYINSGRLAEVPERLKLYRLNDGKVMKGLINRRAAEVALWNKPVSSVVITKPAPVVKQSIVTMVIRFIIKIIGIVFGKKK